MKRRYIVTFLAALLLLTPSCRRDDSITPQEVKEERDKEKREVTGEASAQGWDQDGTMDYKESNSDANE
ncbi:MAG: hypothetical protein J5675_05355 [Bacteroidales bacterium]|nr:hypothetical protein [Bacteroidales bacterium]